MSQLVRVLIGGRGGWRSATLLAFAILVPTRPARAQQRPAVQPGERVRVVRGCVDGQPGASATGASACDASPLVGSLLALSPDSIALRADDATVVYPSSSVTRLEVSRGQTSHWKTGALIGFPVGALIVFSALNTGDSTNPCDPSSNQDAAGMGFCVGVAALAGGVPGALLGGTIGWLIRSERWEPVPLGSVGLRMLPDGRPGVAFSLTF